MRKMFARGVAGAVMAVMTNAAWGRPAELPEWLFGIDVASLNSTGQWVNVKHKDWNLVKVVRGASGRAECIVLRSRDLSQEWDSKTTKSGFLACRERKSPTPKSACSLSKPISSIQHHFSQ